MFNPIIATHTNVVSTRRAPPAIAGCWYTAEQVAYLPLVGRVSEGLRVADHAGAEHYLATDGGVRAKGVPMELGTILERESRMLGRTLGAGVRLRAHEPRGSSDLAGAFVTFLERERGAVVEVLLRVEAGVAPLFCDWCVEPVQRGCRKHQMHRSYQEGPQRSTGS